MAMVANNARPAPLDLGELEPYDSEKSISLREAATLLPGRKEGEHLNPDVLRRRWSNPLIGCYPMGALPGRPWMVFPAVMILGQKRTMPSWTLAFKKALERCGEPVPMVPVARPARSRRASAKRAKAALDKAGIGTSNGKKK